MKKQSVALYRLVKSLSKFEKGYYVKYATNLPGKGGDRYTGLFHIIDSLETYDEDELSQKIKEQGYHKHAHRIKNYLYVSIVECLQRVNRYSNTLHKVLNQLDQAYLLYDRGLYKQSSIHAESALNQADGHSYRNLALMALNTMYRNNLALHDTLLENKGLEIREEACRLAAAEYQYQLLEKAKLHLVAQYRTEGPAQDEEERKHYHQLYEKHTQRIDKDLFDLQCTVVYNHLETTMGYCLRDFKRMADGMRRSYMQLKEAEHPYKNPESILGHWNNYVSSLILSRNFAEALAEMEYIQNWLEAEKENISPPIYHNYQAACHVQLLSINIMDNDQALNAKTKDEASAYLSTHQFAEHYHTKHLMNLIIFHLYSNEPEEALPLVNQFLANPEYRKMDIAHFAEIQLINLVVHAKLGNDQLLENLMPNLLRKERLPNKPFAKLLLDHLTAYFNCETTAAQQQWKANLLAELDTFYNEYPDEYYWQAVDYRWYFKEVF